MIFNEKVTEECFGGPAVLPASPPADPALPSKEPVQPCLIPLPFRAERQKTFHRRSSPGGINKLNNQTAHLLVSAGNYKSRAAPAKTSAARRQPGRVERRRADSGFRRLRQVESAKVAKEAPLKWTPLFDVCELRHAHGRL